MNEIDFKQRLLDLKAELLNNLQALEQSANPVALDQQRVGRLSRMDAMQMQSMAKAEQARAKVQLKKIAAALQRIESDEFGDCQHCGEIINPKRLEIDPATPLCLSCAELAE